MDRLWAPWRVHYVRSKKNKSCIFCKKSKSKNDKKNYIISRGRYVFSILNIFPYNNGHIMVAPYRHVKELAKLKEAELLELMKMTVRMIKILKKILKPDALNIGMNLGKTAGAGFANHLHIHIVPRWQGDTNFMTVISDSKVISEALDELYERLIKQKG